MSVLFTPTRSRAAQLFSRAAICASINRIPSCGTLASSAFRRNFIDVRSWRCHTQRTPAGEIDKPRVIEALQGAHLAPGRLLDRQRHHRLLARDRRAVLQYRLAAADLPQRRFATFLVQLFEPVEAVAAVPILQAWLTPGLSRGQAPIPATRPFAGIIFCSCVIPVALTPRKTNYDCLI